MKLITADIGNYSTKIIVSEFSTKNSQSKEVKELILDLDQINVLEERAIWELQLRSLVEFLNSFTEEYKLVLNVPSEILTYRFKDVPTTSRKKANQMLPFLLEEEIPFLLSEAHLASSIIINNKKAETFTNIIKKEEFKPFYDLLKRFDIKPRLLTSHASAYKLFISTHKAKLPPTFCILDMGHETTDAYFFQDGELVSVHSSFIAGKAITESISENYQIEKEEALLYKHQNCFVLTDDQYAKVDENQRTFSKFMNQTLEPLLKEFKRWELSFRIRYGYSINEVFLTGGTANIKNIHNYISQEIAIRVSHLDSCELEGKKSVDNDSKFIRKFNTATILSYCHLKPQKVINILRNEFTLGNSFVFPIESFNLYAIRVAILGFIVFLGLSLETVLLKKHINEIDKTLNPLLGNSSLELSAREKRMGVTNFEGTKQILKRKSKFIEQKVSTLQSALDINSLKSLETLISLSSGLSVEITQLNMMNMGDFSVVFKANDLAELKRLESNLQSSKIKNLFIDLNEGAILLTVNGSEL